MIKKRITVINKTGLHARTGQKFVMKAKEYKSEVKVKTNEDEASAKSLLKILKLGIECGEEIEIICDGEDDKEAMEGLVETLEHLE